MSGSPGAAPGPLEVSPAAVLVGLTWGIPNRFSVGIDTALAPELKSPM